MTLPGALQRTGRLVLLFLLVAVPAAYFLLSPDRPILFPSRDPLAHAGATRAALPFRGGELEIWTARSRPREGQGRKDSGRAVDWLLAE